MYLVHILHCLSVQLFIRLLVHDVWCCVPCRYLKVCASLRMISTLICLMSMRYGSFLSEFSFSLFKSVLCCSNGNVVAYHIAYEIVC